MPTRALKFEVVKVHYMYLDIQKVPYLQSRNTRVARRRRMVVAETPTRRKSRGNLSGREEGHEFIIGMLTSPSISSLILSSALPLLLVTVQP